jgi:alkylation response protein AidB-like acyl-CoA dehydrogenase
VISGTKSFNTGSGALGRDLTIVSAASTEGGAVMGLVRLDADGVRPHHDWQVMGQRATNSQTITYDDVFVPDGWHAPITPPPMQFMVSARLMLAAVLVGIGEGALEAGVDLVRRMDRATLTSMPDAESDHLAHRRIGEHRIQLAAARALLLRAAAAARTLDPADPWPAVFGALASTAAGRAAALAVTSGIFDLTGARSTAERNRLDRFWRNARTLSLHDPVDATAAMLGKQLLTGEIPVLRDYFRMG